MAKDNENLMDKIVSLCKRRGFIFPGSEIYGGLAGTFDWGPLGVLLKYNITESWWRKFVTSREDIFPVDAAIIMNPRVWEASGHVAGFSDPIPSSTGVGDGGRFNTMFKTSIGAGKEAATAYLRPETAQGMFVNFKNIVDAFHPKLPFGLAQIGKAFRNEIAPRDFLFRAREFEQMEIEYLIPPPLAAARTDADLTQTDAETPSAPPPERGRWPKAGGGQLSQKVDWQDYFEYWKDEMLEWMEEISLDMAKVHELEVPEKDRAHYSKRTVDFEFEYPFGQKELFGLAYRGDFDLKNHKLDYIDPETNEKFIPHVIEPTFGVDRAVLAVLLSAYSEDELGGEKRVFLKLKPAIAPVKVAVFPLLKNKPELVEKARQIYSNLKSEIFNLAFDDNGNIGKRYRRQDEIGTPFCVTIDFDTLKDDTVTVRDRDTGNQERVKVEELIGYIKNKLS